MSRPRRNFTAEQKAEIVRRHVAGKEPVSKLAEEFELLPTQIHTWVNQVLAKPPGPLSGRRATARRATRRPASSTWKPNWPRRTKSSPSCWRPTSAKKNAMGSSERTLGSPRHATRSSIASSLDDSDASGLLAGWTGEQVPSLEESLRQSQRAQRMDTPRPSGWTIGRSRRSSTSRRRIRWKAIAAWPS